MATRRRERLPLRKMGGRLLLSRWDFIDFIDFVDLIASQLRQW
jgi:hypothetical protein